MDSHVDNSGPGTLHPWQTITIGSGLALHGAAELRLDVATLQAEFAALDAAVPPEARGFHQNGRGEGWTSIPLWVPSFGREAAGAPAATADFMPSVRALFGRPGWALRSSYVMRQSARGTLAWHFDTEALYLDHMRLLIPIHAPAGAVTRIGHETVAYPEGQGWSGDFSFPHQVENDTDLDRVVVIMDLAVTPEIRALFPPALAEDAGLRAALCVEARNALLFWRQRPAV